MNDLGFHELQLWLRTFSEERGWEQYHTPRNLAALIASEAGELLSLFRWDQDSMRERREDVEDELADVLFGILRFADVAEIDLIAASTRKLEKNRNNYPRDQTEPDRLRVSNGGTPAPAAALDPAADLDA